MRRLSDFVSPNVNPSVLKDKSYRIYTIKGKAGKLRTIEEPTGLLKEVQAQLIPFFEQWKFHPSCLARKGFGIADNAKIHEEAAHLLRVDIKSCYPSITRQHIERAILSSTLSEEMKTDFLKALDFCLFSKGGKEILPTGAPTSPILCNIALTPLDYKIETLAKEESYNYSRYIDDLHISTTQKERKWELLDRISALLKEEELRVNKKKTKWMMPKKADQAIVTGVRIGKADKVPREFKRILRARLNNLARDNKPIDAETRGCLAYVKSIDETIHQKFLAYYQRRLEDVFQKRLSAHP